MSRADKPLVWLGVVVKTPPFSVEARVEAGFLLRRLQQGHSLELPQSRPMPSIGPRCHELRINDETRTWRLFYRMDPDAIIVAELLEKKTRTTPKLVIDRVKRRLREYDDT